MLLDCTPPAEKNEPPAKSAGPDPLPSSSTARASTSPPTPLPSADQEDPFHFAIRLAATPPATMNRPPAYSAGPLPSSSVRALTQVSIPLPSVAHAVPSHFAT